MDEQRHDEANAMRWLAANVRWGNTLRDLRARDSTVREPEPLRVPAVAQVAPVREERAERVVGRVWRPRRSRLDRVA